MNTLLCLLRHGETLWNREKLIQGQSESPLSPLGREQALSWGVPLLAWNFTRILTSTLGRALETAALCNQALHLPRQQDPRLCEQNWGNWVGLSIRELRDHDPEFLAREEAKGWGFRPPGGESRTEVLERAQAALLDAAKAHPGERVLVVSHNGVLRALARHLLGSDYMPGSSDPVERGKLLCLACDGRKLRLLAPAQPLEDVL